MRILFVVQNYYPSIGGSQELIRNLAERCIEVFGDEASVVTTNALLDTSKCENSYVASGKEVVNGVNVYRCNINKLIVKLVKFIKKAFAWLGIQSSWLSLFSRGPISLEMFRVIFNAPVDIIVVTPGNYLHSFYTVLQKKVPVVVIGAMHYNNGVDRILLSCAKRCDMYLAHSSFERSVLLERGVAKEKVEVIGCGIEIGKFQQANIFNSESFRCMFGIGENEKIVTYLGRLASYKGINELLDAMFGIWRERDDVYLLIAGADHGYYQVIEKKVDSLNPALKRRVMLFRNIGEDEKLEILAETDIFVSASKEESFGISYLEAMAAGAVVIGSRIPAVMSWLGDRKQALLVEPASSQAIQTAIEELLSNKDLFFDLQRNGYELAKKYSWDRVVRRHREIYEKLISPR